MAMPRLTITHGDAAQDKPIDRSPFVVGRDPTCDLTLHHAWLSRRHLVFESIDGQWHVGNESRNEVTLDGVRLEGRQPVADGGTLVVGPLLVRFELAAATTTSNQVTDTVSLTLAVGDVFAKGEHLARLADLSGRLADSDDPGAAATVAAAAACDLLDARAAAVVIEDGPSILGASGTRPDHVSESLTKRALDGGTTLIADHAPNVADAASIAAQSVGPAILAPLGGVIRGVLYVDRAVGAPPFTAEDASFCTILAHLVGPAIDAAMRAASVIDARDRLADERVELLRDIERRGHFGRLIGSSPPMQKLANAIAKVAPADATVLILGETGAGKELVARETHQRSRRSDAAFFALNCAALPDALIESELFGHKKGAFTGADSDRRGVFELADGGTVFLDEVGELPLAAQAKVLRVLDAKEILPLGGARPISVNVRLVAATHRDLAADVEAGRFRQDLFFRLNVFPIVLPPLRDRLDDIPALARHFVDNSTEAQRKRLGPPTQRALAALARHQYPGNVRELAHIIERAAILADDGETLDVDHLPDEIAGSAPVRAATPSTPANVTSLRAAVAAYEKQLIIDALEHGGWNRTQTAKRLEISLRAFMDKLKRYEIKGPTPTR